MKGQAMRNLKLHEFTRVLLLDSNPLAKARMARGSEGLIPFRAPHYSTSGEGVREECRLSVGGVLYLDEAANFSRAAISTISACLRQGPRFGPALVILDGRPLVGTGIAKPSDEAQEKHAARLSEIVSTLNEGINFDDAA